jgi:hypothetical protein
MFLRLTDLGFLTYEGRYDRGHDSGLIRKWIGFAMNVRLYYTRLKSTTGLLLRSNTNSSLALPYAESSLLLQSIKRRPLTYAPESSLVPPMPPDAPEACAFHT